MTPDPSAPAIALPVQSVTRAVDQSRPNYRLLGLLALGHLVIDTNQGSLPALLPYLKAVLGLTYTATGVIVLMANITSSLIQPLFGFLADKTARRWLLPLSVFLSSVGIALTGVAPSYYVLLALVMVSGFGVAAYHPEGYRTATQVAGERKATGVSIFSTGGNIGIAVGPPLITLLLVSFGLPGTLGMLLPGLLVTVLLMAVLPGLSRPLPARAQGATLAPKTMVKGMSLLVLVVAIRSWTQLGFTTFLPFYWRDVLHGDPRLVGTLLAVFLGSGAIGTLAAGPVADRVGQCPDGSRYGLGDKRPDIVDRNRLRAAVEGQLVELESGHPGLVSAFGVVVRDEAADPQCQLASRTGPELHGPLTRFRFDPAGQLPGLR